MTIDREIQRAHYQLDAKQSNPGHVAQQDKALFAHQMMVGTAKAHRESTLASEEHNTK